VSNKSLHCFGVAAIPGTKLDPNVLTIVEHFFDHAATFTPIKEDMLNFYKKTDCVFKFHIPLVRDDGTVDSISAYRAHHKTHRLPTIGSFRISDQLGFQEIQGLSLLATIRNAVLELPLGGAMGGFKCDYNVLSKRERESLVRKYTIELAKKNSIGASIDVQ
jgi:glutamate dehydrogenase (NAD(P)+)